MQDLAPQLVQGLLNLRTGRADLPVASGFYICRVDVDGVGSKTDRLAVFIERERLDNY